MGGAIWASLQVFLDRQAGDDAAILGHQADARLRRLVRGHLVQRLVVQPDLAMVELRAVHPGNGAQGRGLARAVAAQQGEDLALVHVEADVLNDVAFAVIGLHVPDRQEGGAVSATFLPLEKSGLTFILSRTCLAVGARPRSCRFTQIRFALPWDGP